MIKLKGSSWDGASDGTNKFQIGDFVSAAVGSGNILDATNTKIISFYADDNAAAITTGSSVRVGEARMLCLGANASADTSIGGWEGHIKITAAVGSIGHKYGLWGYCELNNDAAAIASTTCCGVFAMLDVPASASIATGAIASAICIGSNDLSGTHTGKAAAIHVQNPVAGTWDTLFTIGSATGCSGAIGGATIQATGLKVTVNTTDYFIPLYA